MKKIQDDLLANKVLTFSAMLPFHSHVLCDLILCMVQPSTILCCICSKESMFLQILFYIFPKDVNL